MIVAIWSGNGKPSILNDYLNPFVIELNEILESGILVNSYQIFVTVRCIIADTPARSYIKGICRKKFSNEFSIPRNVMFMFFQKQWNYVMNLILYVGTIGHNSYHGCQKCMAQGVYNRAKSKMCFPRIVMSQAERLAELRTDERFRSRYQPEHHKEYSVFEMLSIDMVRAFPTSDSLHLLDLGIMKRFTICTLKTGFFEKIQNSIDK